MTKQNDEIKMMEIPSKEGWYDEDITKHTPDYMFGKDMKDYVTNSIYDDWCRWYFPEGIKEKIEDDQLYLVWCHYRSASDPQDSSCSYKVYYIEKTPQYVKDMLYNYKTLEKELKKYQHKYEKYG